MLFHSPKISIGLLKATFAGFGYGMEAVIAFISESDFKKRSHAK